MEQSPHAPGAAPQEGPFHSKMQQKSRFRDSKTPPENPNASAQRYGVSREESEEKP